MFGSQCSGRECSKLTDHQSFGLPRAPWGVLFGPENKTALPKIRYQCTFGTEPHKLRRIVVGSKPWQSQSPTFPRHTPRTGGNCREENFPKNIVCVIRTTASMGSVARLKPSKVDSSLDPLLPQHEACIIGSSSEPRDPSLLIEHYATSTLHLSSVIRPELQSKDGPMDSPNLSTGDNLPGVSEAPVAWWRWPWVQPVYHLSHLHFRTTHHRFICF